MPASAAKINQKQAKKYSSNQLKKLNFALTQNDKILAIFLCLPAKLQLFQDYRALLSEIEKSF